MGHCNSDINKLNRITTRMIDNRRGRCTGGVGEHNIYAAKCYDSTPSMIDNGSNPIPTYPHHGTPIIANQLICTTNNNNKIIPHIHSNDCNRCISHDRHIRRRRRRQPTKLSNNILTISMLLLISLINAQRLVSAQNSLKVLWKRSGWEDIRTDNSMPSEEEFDISMPSNSNDEEEVVRQQSLEVGTVSRTTTKVCEEQTNKGQCENNSQGNRDLYCIWVAQQCIALPVNRPTSSTTTTTLSPSSPTNDNNSFWGGTTKSTGCAFWYYDGSSCLREINVPPSGVTLYDTVSACCNDNFGTVNCPTYDGCAELTEVPSSAPFGFSWSKQPTSRPTTGEPTLKPSREPSKEPSKAPTEEPTVKPSRSPSKSPTNKPSMSPSTSPSIGPTLFPTKQPTKMPSKSPTPPPSSAPSIALSDLPSSSPTESPTFVPTKSPSQSPTLSTRPTPAGPWPSSSPTVSTSPTFSPSSSPSGSPTPIPTSTDPPTTSSPTDSPTTIAPTASDYIPPNNNFKVQSSMILYNMADTLKQETKWVSRGDVKKTWVSITGKRIYDETKEIIGINGDDLVVTLVLDKQELLDGSTRLRRGLQSSLSLSPLQLNFTTTIAFSSEDDMYNQTSANGMVAAGFVTPTDQRDYIKALKGADKETYKAVKKMNMAVEGEVITEKEDSKPLKPVPQDEINIYYIIGGAACGALLIMLVGGIVYKRRKRQSGAFPPSPHAKSASKSTSSSPNPPQDALNRQNQPTQIGIPPPTQNYFGTIEANLGEDDVSTIGDPYFGEGCSNPEPRADETVAESMISSEQEMYVFGVGRKRLNTGGGSTLAQSTITGGTANNPTGRMEFGDDPTLEDVYRTPDPSNASGAAFDEEEGSSNLQRLVVVAPGGKLGIVIDNPTGDMPVVHAIKESSVLHGRLQVGDLLLSVDEVDCRGMSAVQVSRLISTRSRNPTRNLVLLRSSAGN